MEGGVMTTSILDDVKHTLGLLPEDTSFDSDLVLHINTVFGILNQLGVGPTLGYEITDKTNTWDEFYDDPRLNAVKSYVFLRVKLMFDPPTTGFLTDALNRQIQELEFRLNVVVDY
jgi:hypothetical protein